MQRGISLLFGLQYFVQVYGKTLIAVGPVYTSQDCSNCGNLVKKTLSTRTHICGGGAVLDRDHNAAATFWRLGLKQAGINLNTVGYTEINAWGQTDLYYEGGSKTEISSTGPIKNPRAFKPGSVKEDVIGKLDFKQEARGFARTRTQIDINSLRMSLEYFGEDKIK